MNVNLVDFCRDDFKLENEAIMADTETQEAIEPFLLEAVNFLEYKLASCSTESGYTDVTEAHQEEDENIEEIIQRVELQSKLTQELPTLWHRDISIGTLMKEKAQDIVEHLPFYDNGLAACLTVISLCNNVLQSKSNQPEALLKIGQLSQIYKQAYTSCHVLLDISQIAEDKTKPKRTTRKQTDPRTYRLQMINKVLELLLKRDNDIVKNKERIKTDVTGDACRIKPYKKEELNTLLTRYYYSEFKEDDKKSIYSWINQLIDQAYEIRTLERQTFPK